MKKFQFKYIALLLSLALFPITTHAAQSPPILVSEAAILMDGDTGQILYEKKANTSYAPASITKLMTALLTLENLAPDEEITFSRNAVMSIESGSSHIGMREGEVITVEDALHGLLLNSANEVANCLAETVSGSIDAFAETMNERATALGALNSNFLNPHGLFEEDHVTTAYDMALITKELLGHDFFLEVMSHPTWQIAPTNLVDETRYLHQSHKLLNPYKDATLYREDSIAGKSGYTRLSGYTLVTVAERDNRTLIAVSIRTDANHLYSDTNALLDYGFDAFQSVTVTPEDYLQTLPVIAEGTLVGEATLMPLDSTSVQIPISSTLNALTYIPNTPEHVASTAVLHDQIGSIDVHLNTDNLITIPLEITAINFKKNLEVQAQSDETPEVSDEVELPSKKRNPWLIFLAITFVTLTLAGYFAYVYKSKTMSYMTYKRLRDAQQSDPYKNT